MTKIRAYYAHSMKIYDTPQEKAELKFLRKEYDVICPNNDIGSLHPFNRYLNIVRWSDILVISVYEGHITAGVYAEAQHALELGKEVLFIETINSSLRLTKVFSVEIIANERDYKNDKYAYITPKEWR